jgi:hypothetical protein
MRAKSVNFERGVDPKEAMGIGGVDFTKEFLLLFKKWKDDVEKALTGKNISAVLRRLQSDGRFGEFEKGTIKVQLFLGISDTQCTSSKTGGPLYICKVQDEDGEVYEIYLDQKIRIHES